MTAVPDGEDFEKYGRMAMTRLLGSTVRIILIEDNIVVQISRRGDPLNVKIASTESRIHSFGLDAEFGFAYEGVRTTMDCQ